MNNVISLINFTKGSFGNIFKDSQLNLYKITVISDNGYMNASNINELVIFNLFKTLKHKTINFNMVNELDDCNNNNATHHNFTSYSQDIYDSIENEKIFMQSSCTKFHNQNTLNEEFTFKCYDTQDYYDKLLYNRLDKILLINKLSNYQYNLFKFIKNNHEKVINNFDVIAKKILKSVAILHHNNFLHGDIKSLNILINDENNISLTDYGGIKIANFDNYLLSCTITSRCPEDIKHRFFEKKNYFNNGFKSDIWSIGIIFAEMLLGYNPIEKIYKQIISKTNSEHEILKNLTLFYESIDYIDVSEIIKINKNKNINSILTDDLQKKLLVIDKMLYVEPDDRISTIEEVYEQLFNEKFMFNFEISYNYDYQIFNINHKFDILYNIRKKYYKIIIDICNTFHILFMCPLIFDVFDRVLIKLNDKIIEKTIYFNNKELTITLCAIIILVCGLYNQNQPSYESIFKIINMAYNTHNTSLLNNNILNILILLDYDIYRPFNIYFCPYYFLNNNCICEKNILNIKNIYTIHNNTEKKIFEQILMDIINNNLIGLSPTYYHHKFSKINQ